MAVAARGRNSTNSQTARRISAPISQIWNAVVGQKASLVVPPGCVHHHLLRRPGQAPWQTCSPIHANQVIRAAACPHKDLELWKTQQAFASQ